jgi:hypothetical protein
MLVLRMCESCNDYEFEITPSLLIVITVIGFATIVMSQLGKMKTKIQMKVGKIVLMILLA